MRNILFVLGMLLTTTAANAVSPIPPNVPPSGIQQVMRAKINELSAATAGGALTNGKILVGNGSNVATAVTPSGAVTMTNAGVFSAKDATSDGNYALKIAKASFAFADGDLDVGAHGLGVSLPAKAIIIRSWIHIATQLSDSGTCTLAISCEDANNIKTATDITGSAADALIEGESTGAASAFKKSIASACEITATVADGGSCVPAAGAGEVYVMYTVHN